MKELSIRLARTGAQLLAIATGAYGLGMSGLLLMRTLFGDRWWPLGLFDSFAHLLIMPALPLLAVCLLVRRRGLALTQAAPAVVFLISYGVFFIARPVRAVPNTPELGVLTFNINKHNTSLDAIIQVIRDSGADVVAFQELNETITAGLRQELGDEFPYQAMHPDTEDSYRGVGIISRYPIEQDKYWASTGLGNQRIEIDVNGETVVIHNAHPTHPLNSLRNGGNIRARAVSRILDHAVDDSGAVLMVGDFNMTDQSGDYQRVTSRFMDSYREVGWGMGFTFPDFNQYMGLKFLPPLARIDYVFHDSGLQPLEARVWPTSGGSDHRPLFVRLAFVPKP